MIGWSKTRTVSARLVFNTFTPMSWLFELELHSYAENSRLLAVEMDYAGGLCFMCLCVVSCCPSLVDRSNTSRPTVTIKPLITTTDRPTDGITITHKHGKRPPVFLHAGFISHSRRRWLGSRVVSVLDSGAEGPGFKSQPRRCRITVLGKLFTPTVPLFTKQQNWQQPS